MIASLVAMAEQGNLPDNLIRIGIKRLLRERLKSLPAKDAQARQGWVNDFLLAMGQSPVAELTDAANEQHYEVPVSYFDRVLGPRKKYSCCYWDEHTHTLAQAEEYALQLTCDHADIQDGQQILELGCGWGSLTLWMANRFPSSRITAVSNSSSQRRYILEQAEAQGLSNVHVITADMNGFDIDTRFDRVVSVEMFEHMRNWGQLFSRVNHWLKPGGKLFMHVFCHRDTPYFFESQGPGDWMASHFFSGGMMPSAGLPLYFQQHLQYQNSWVWNGNHYARTLAAWLKAHDSKALEISEVIYDIYGLEGSIWGQRWRLFYMACEELFRMNNGNEWFVVHYLMQKPDGRHG